MSSKQKFWQNHIDAWRVSGLSQSAYCKEHALSLSSFGYWLHRRAEPKSAATAIPITVSRPGADERVDIRLPNGLTVQMPLTLDGARLLPLLRELAAC